MSTAGSLPPSQEARAHHASTLEHERDRSAWAGWVAFAVTVLALLGALNMFQGLLALFDEGYFVARGEDLVLVSYDAWGVVLLLWGGLQLLAAFALDRGRSWARWVAILAVLAHAVVQVGFLPAFPLLSIVLITLDVVVLFALTAKWDEARSAY